MIQKEPSEEREWPQIWKLYNLPFKFNRKKSRRFYSNWGKKKMLLNLWNFSIFLQIAFCTLVNEQESMFDVFETIKNDDVKYLNAKFPCFSLFSDKFCSLVLRSELNYEIYSITWCEIVLFLSLCGNSYIELPGITKLILSKICNENRSKEILKETHAFIYKYLSKYENNFNNEEDISDHFEENSAKSEQNGGILSTADFFWKNLDREEYFDLKRPNKSSNNEKTQSETSTANIAQEIKPLRKKEKPYLNSQLMKEFLFLLKKIKNERIKVNFPVYEEFDEKITKFYENVTKYYIFRLLNEEEECAFGCLDRNISDKTTSFCFYRQNSAAFQIFKSCSIIFITNLPKCVISFRNKPHELIGKQKKCLIDLISLYFNRNQISQESLTIFLDEIFKYFDMDKIFFSQMKALDEIRQFTKNETETFKIHKLQFYDSILARSVMKRILQSRHVHEMIKSVLEEFSFQGGLRIDDFDTWLIWVPFETQNECVLDRMYFFFEKIDEIRNPAYLNVKGRDKYIFECNQQSLKMNKNHLTDIARSSVILSGHVGKIEIKNFDLVGGVFAGDYLLLNFMDLSTDRNEKLSSETLPNREFISRLSKLRPSACFTEFVIKSKKIYITLLRFCLVTSLSDSLVTENHRQISLLRKCDSGLTFSAQDVLVKFAGKIPNHIKECTFNGSIIDLETKAVEISLEPGDLPVCLTFCQCMFQRNIKFTGVFKSILITESFSNKNAIISIEDSVKHFICSKNTFNICLWSRYYFIPFNDQSNSMNINLNSGICHFYY